MSRVLFTAGVAGVLNKQGAAGLGFFCTMWGRRDDRWLLLVPQSSATLCKHLCAATHCHKTRHCGAECGSVCRSHSDLSTVCCPLVPQKKLATMCTLCRSLFATMCTLCRSLFTTPLCKPCIFSQPCLTEVLHN